MFPAVPRSRGLLFYSPFSLLPSTLRSLVLIIAHLVCEAFATHDTRLVSQVSHLFADRAQC